MLNRRYLTYLAIGGNNVCLSVQPIVVVLVAATLVHIPCNAHNRTPALLLTASSTQHRPYKRRRNNFSQAPAARPLSTPRCSSIASQLGRDRRRLVPTPRSAAEKARLLICQRNLRMTSPVPVPRAREIAVQQCDCKLIACAAIGRPLHPPQSFCAVTLSTRAYRMHLTRPACAAGDV